MKEVNFPLNDDIIDEDEDNLSDKEIIFSRVLLSESDGKS